jgi:hypothetical protein
MSGIKNGVGGFNSILKNPPAPRRTGQAPLPPLVRACPDGNREGVAPAGPQTDINNSKILFSKK